MTDSTALYTGAELAQFEQEIRDNCPGIPGSEVDKACAYLTNPTHTPAALREFYRDIRRRFAHVTFGWDSLHDRVVLHGLRLTEDETDGGPT